MALVEKTQLEGIDSTMPNCKLSLNAMHQEFLKDKTTCRQNINPQWPVIKKTSDL
jgi:hypothetical protein